MHRYATTRRVVVFEAPRVGADAYAEVQELARNLWLVVPHVRGHATAHERLLTMRFQLAMVCAERRILNPILWWYSCTPVAVARGMAHALCVYDVFDAPDLAGAASAPQRALFAVTDLLLSGDERHAALWRTQHPSAHYAPNADPPARSWDDAWTEVDVHVRAALSRKHAYTSAQLSRIDPHAHAVDEGRQELSGACPGSLRS